MASNNNNNNSAQLLCRNATEQLQPHSKGVFPPLGALGTRRPRGHVLSIDRSSLTALDRPARSVQRRERPVRAGFRKEKAFQASIAADRALIGGRPYCSRVRVRDRADWLARSSCTVLRQRKVRNSGRRIKRKGKRDRTIRVAARSCGESLEASVE